MCLYVLTTGSGRQTLVNLICLFVLRIAVQVLFKCFIHFIDRAGLLLFLNTAVAIFFIQKDYVLMLSNFNMF
jgi:hypothetical protein